MVWDSNDRRNNEVLTWQLRGIWCNGAEIDRRGTVTILL